MSRRLCSLYGQILPASCPGSPGKAVKFLLYFLEIKRYSVIFYVCKFLINVGQNAHFLYIITQFSSTEIGNFPDDFIFWTRYAIFIGWSFAFSGNLVKRESTKRRSTITLVKNNKNPKVDKNWLPQKFRDGDTPNRRPYTRRWDNGKQFGRDKIPFAATKLPPFL